MPVVIERLIHCRHASRPVIISPAETIHSLLQDIKLKILKKTVINEMFLPLIYTVKDRI